MREHIHKLLQPRKYNIRVNIRISKAGNAVLSFPTCEEKDQAKKILKKTKEVRKINDRDDRMIPIWVKHVPLEAKPDELIKELIELNPILESLEELIQDEPLKPYAKWIGSVKKKFRLLVPRNIANFVLTNGFLYSDMIRHPLVRLTNFPSRCKNCLRLHFHRFEDCRLPKACEFCCENHGSGSCPVKDDPSKHSCITCAHHTFHVQPADRQFPHGAFHNECLAYRDQFAHNSQELDRILKEAPSL